ncbi:MAG: hypothetical protein WCP92_06050 [bacterium]
MKSFYDVEIMPHQRRLIPFKNFKFTMKNYTIKNANTPVDQKYIAEYIRLYKDAYGNDPIWREGMIDAKTGKNYSFKEFEQLKTSQDVSDFVEYYPDKDVLAMWETSVQKQNRLDVAIQKNTSDELCGVISGYNDPLIQLNKNKLQLDTSDFTSMVNRLQLQKTTIINYLAELFIETMSQGQ